jgi:hypothetical protein
MTVEDLIDELHRYPKDTIVKLEVGGDGAIHSSREVHVFSDGFGSVVIEGR